VYIADASNQRIRKVNTSGIITTFAGGGGSTADGIAATAEALNFPTGVAVDVSGNVYIADAGDNRIRKVNTSGIITTVAGTGVASFSGDGGPANVATLNSPYGVAVDAAGNVYIADQSNNRLRMVNTAGIINTIAGDGSFTYSGDGGPATAAGIANLYRVGVDVYGNIIVPDYSASRIRAINTLGIINTIAGTGTYSISGDGGPATAATLEGPVAVGFGPAGNLYYADYDASMVRKITLSPSVCVGSTVALSDATGGGSWSSANTSVATVSSGGVVTGVAAGVTTITYTGPSGCASFIPVRVNAVPGSITGTPNVCVGATNTLTDGTGGGLWTSSNTALATIGSTSGIVGGSNAGTLTITYTLPYTGCFSTAAFTVNTTPPANTGTATVCTGSTTTLSNTASGGTWSSSNTGLAMVGSTGIVTGVASGTPIITYMLAAGGCYATTAVAVNTTPSANVGSNNVCVGSSTTLSNSLGGGTWSSSAIGTASVIGSTGVVTGGTAGTADISYTMPTGCFAVTPMTVNSTPAVITGASTVCTGATTNLSDATAGGTWSSSTGSVATVSGTGVVTGVSAGTTTISYTTNPGSCFVTFAMTVNQTPPSIVGNSTLCVGVPTPLTDGTGGGVWTSSNGAQATVGSSSGIATGLSAGTTPTITYTLPGGCFATLPTTVSAQPASITGTFNVCVGSTTALSDASAVGSWSSSNATLGSVDGAGVVTGIAAGTPVITYMLPGGCVSTQAVTVNTTPAAITGTPVVCVTQTTNLSDATSGGLWSSSATGQAIVGSTSGIVTGVSAGNPSIIYTLSNGCSTSVTATVNAMPVVFNVTGGGAYCSGGTGVHIGLNGSSSAPSTNYQLMMGTATVGSAAAGTGSPLDFGTFTTAGTYTVTATVVSSGCSTAMTGSATITINPLPTTFTVTGGGSYCTGGSGVAVGLSGSSPVGVSYQLYDNAVAVGSTVAGTGALLNFGLQTAAGTYTVIATNTSTGCTNTMLGSPIVTVNPLPNSSYSVTGGGGYCAGLTGVPVGLSTSDVGNSYQLFRGGLPVGSPIPGTGSALSYGLQTTAGTYTIVGTITSTGCSAGMTGSVIVTVNPLPITYSVSGGGAFCAGGTGVTVNLSGSTSGVNYQVLNNGGLVGIPVAGTGTSMSFGPYTAPGTYTIAAADASTGCQKAMTGSAVVTVNPLPVVYNVTGGGGYCAGGTGAHIGLNGSDLGVNYQAYNGATSVGGPIAGTGGALDLGLFTTATTYTVTASNPSTGCNSNMTGSRL